MYFKIGVLKIFESLFNNVAGLNACSCIKKWLQHRCFPVVIAKLLRTAFSIENLWWLLLKTKLLIKDISQVIVWILAWLTIRDKTYSKPCKTSKIEPLIIFAKLSVWGVWQGSEHAPMTWKLCIFHFRTG